jgi:hypothetical protein
VIVSALVIYRATGPQSSDYAERLIQLISPNPYVGVFTEVGEVVWVAAEPDP